MVYFKLGSEKMNPILNYFLIFYIYSIIGWITESTYATIKEKKLINRGFLIGPYCPIYGFGSLIMILYLEQYKNNLITVFILSVVLCSILEYFTSYLMEKIFKARWWDYNNEKFNLNGRICGQNSIIFGLGGIAIIYLIHPFINSIINSINTNIISIITVLGLIIFITDTIISFNIVNKLKKSIINIDPKKDATQDITKLVKETLLKSHKTFQTRILNAFPNIDINNIKNKINKLKPTSNKTPQDK